MKRLPRLLRSLQVQLFLWAVLPATLVVIALAFTGVYAHQRTMRDFVSERDLALVHLISRTVEDGLLHGAVGGQGSGLSDWLSQTLGEQPEAISLAVVEESGDVLWRLRPHADSGRGDGDLGSVPLTQVASQPREGSLIVRDDSGDRLLVTFAPVRGAGWSVVAWESVEDLIGPILRLSSLAPIVAAGAAVLSLLILGFGWRTIVRPLRQLAHAAEQVSWGDFSAISEPIGGVQEIQNLHRALADMTERIQGYEAGVRDYLGAVTEGQEAERARLAREIHDGPVQDLIALSQRAEMAKRLVQRGETVEAEALLTELRGAELATVDDLRRMIGALRPSYLEDLGFIPALEVLVRQVAAQTTADVLLEDVCQEKRLAPEAELAAYRIAQEALNNAVQHAQAGTITVRVRCDSDGLVLSVRDDGVGFDLPPSPDLLTQAGHFGLLGMRERAVLLGGSFRVQSTAGQGTRITVHLPVRPPAS